MSGKKITFIFGTALLLAAHDAYGDADDASPNTNTVVTAQTGKLQLVTLRGFVDEMGVVMAAPGEDGKAAASSLVSSPEAGMVSHVNVWEGKKVEQGEELLSLDSRVADVALEFAQKNLERQQKLLAMNNTSQKAVQDAQQQLASAEAERQRLTVRAPLAGVVTSVNTRAGEAVDPATGLVEITDLDRVAVKANIPAADASQLKIGQTVEVETEPPLVAALSYVSPVVNTSNDAVVVRATLPEKSGLRPGQMVQLRIVVAEHTNCLAAPEASVVTDDDNNPVISVVTNDTATQVKVTTGLRDKGWVEVSAPDLKDGETVVTVGAYGLPAQTKIKTPTAGDK